VRFPVSASVFTEAGSEETLKVNGPVTWLVPLVVRIALPVGADQAVKHCDALRKVKSVTLRVPSVLRVKVVMKLSAAPSPVAPVRVASQLPPTLVVSLLLLQP